MDLITGFSSTFLATASAISAGGVMLNMTQNTGGLFTSGTMDCVDTNGDGNCALGGSYGNGVLAINILSVIFNGVLAAMIIWKWLKVRKNVLNRKTLHAVFTMLTLTIMLAVATAGYNLYVQQNFGKELNAGGFGDECPAVTSVAGCNSMGGNSGSAVFGLNIATIVTSGLVLLGYSGLFANRALNPTSRVLDRLF